MFPYYLLTNNYFYYNKNVTHIYTILVQMIDLIQNNIIT